MFLCHLYYMSSYLLLLSRALLRKYLNLACSTYPHLPFSTYIHTYVYICICSAVTCSIYLYMYNMHMYIYVYIFIYMYILIIHSIYISSSSRGLFSTSLTYWYLKGLQLIPEVLDFSDLLPLLFFFLSKFVCLVLQRRIRRRNGLRYWLNYVDVLFRYVTGHLTYP